MKIFKYQLTDRMCKIEMPTGARIISAAFQPQALCIWAGVDPNAKPETRTFVVRKTGEEFPSDNVGIHIASPIAGPGVPEHVYEIPAKGNNVVDLKSKK